MIDVGVSEGGVLGVCGLVWYVNGTWSCLFQLVKDEKFSISTLTPTTVGWNVSSIGISILG